METKSKETKETFDPITIDELTDILSLSIKKDDTNKLVTFLTLLSAYTPDLQLNVGYVGPSSTGKSYTALEISLLFPQEDVIRLASASPNAFYHEQGVYDKAKNTITVDLERKIIIFLDQPSTALLTKLRALLSHDEKEIQAKITDKNQKGGNRTKTVILRGFPAVVFCTAGLNIDEQETTRFILLSPEISQEKLSQTIYERIRKSADISFYNSFIENDERRIQLLKRVKAIKEAHIEDIRIDYAKLIDQMFREKVKVFKPRHQRDVARITNLVKILALLNLWHRKQIDGAIYADKEDINGAFRIWDELAESQDLGLPPYLLNFYKDIIVTKYHEKNSENTSGVNLGVTRNEILQKHFEIYNTVLPDWKLRQQILPMLETAGLVTLDSDASDKRKILIFPTIVSKERSPYESDKIQ